MNNDMNRYLDDFGRDLKQANATVNAPGPGRNWTRLAAVGAAAGIVVALVVALAPGGKGGLGVPDASADAVRQARKALMVENSILHSHVTNKVVNDDGSGGDGTARSFETWRTMKPVRYRTIFAEIRGGKPRDVIENAWAGGVLTDYDPKAKRLNRLIGGGASDPDAPPLSPAGPNPVAALRKVLATGQFRDTGLHDLNGRQVRRLVGIVQSGTRKEQVEYDVDPQTFTPVQMRQTEGVPGTPGYEPYMSVWDFKAFEWLPITKDNLKLLAIDPAPGTKVTTETLKQLRARMARESAAAKGSK